MIVSDASNYTVLKILVILALLTTLLSFVTNSITYFFPPYIERHASQWSVRHTEALKYINHLTDWVESMLQNLSSEMFGALITFYLIDMILQSREKRLEQERAELSEKQKLIRQLRSRDNGLALQAIEELRANGGLFDGVLAKSDISKADLKDSDLSGANLQGAILRFSNFERATIDGANLSEANLERANLKSASLIGADISGAFLFAVNFENANLSGVNLKDASFVTEEQLSKADMLWGATMPNGELYNGYFDLEGDIEEARKWGVRYGDPDEKLAFYTTTPSNHPTNNI